MSTIILDFNKALEKAQNDILHAKEELAKSNESLKVAKGLPNDKYIQQTQEYLDSIASKPEECLAEYERLKQNYNEVKSSKESSQSMIDYAKQLYTDAKIRYVNAKKDVKDAKKANLFAHKSGDSDAIDEAQKAINNNKLDITKGNLACDRVICDAKEYIRKQAQIISENQELVSVQDADAIKKTEEAKAEINEAKQVIAKAKKILPFYYSAKKYYERHTQAFEALIALLPAMLILGLFMIFPLLNTFAMSFMENFTFKRGAGIFAIAHRFDSFGFGEYIAVLRDPVFIQALKNTVVLVVVSVPLTIIIALFISVALNGIKKLQGMYQTIFFLPYVTNTIALGMVFKVLFATNNGLINAIFGTDIGWLTDASAKGYWTSLVVITTYTVWNGLAFKILIFLSGLQSIDKQYYDAALIDGASRRRIFSKITVPLLSPMILYTVITSFIGAFKSYSHIISVFGSGPNIYGPYGNTNMWITVVGYIYNQMPNLLAPGALSKASAGAVILLIIILLITVLQFIVSKKRVHY